MGEGSSGIPPGSGAASGNRRRENERQHLQHQQPRPSSVSALTNAALSSTAPPSSRVAVAPSSSLRQHHPSHPHHLVQNHHPISRKVMGEKKAHPHKLRVPSSTSASSTKHAPRVGGGGVPGMAKKVNSFSNSSTAAAVAAAAARAPDVLLALAARGSAAPGAHSGASSFGGGRASAVEGLSSLSTSSSLPFRPPGIAAAASASAPIRRVLSGGGRSRSVSSGNAVNPLRRPGGVATSLSPNPKIHRQTLPSQQKKQQSSQPRPPHGPPAPPSYPAPPSTSSFPSSKHAHSHHASSSSSRVSTSSSSNNVAVASALLASGEDVRVSVRLGNRVLVDSVYDEDDHDNYGRGIVGGGEHGGDSNAGKKRSFQHPHHDSSSPATNGIATMDCPKMEEGSQGNPRSVTNDPPIPRHDHHNPSHGHHRNKDRVNEEYEASGGVDHPYQRQSSSSSTSSRRTRRASFDADDPTASTCNNNAAVNAGGETAAPVAATTELSRQSSAASATGGSGNGGADIVEFNYADPTLLLGLLGGSGKIPTASSSSDEPPASADGLVAVSNNNLPVPCCNEPPSSKTANRSIGGCTTIPNGMDSFLDALSNEQRMMRHRHVPTADGFRRLYKSEIRRDMALARRRTNKKACAPSSSNSTPANAGEEAVSGEGETGGAGAEAGTGAGTEDTKMADAEGETQGESGNAAATTTEDSNENEPEEKKGSDDDDNAASHDENEYERPGGRRRDGDDGLDRSPPALEAFVPPLDDIVAMADRTATNGSPPVASMLENMPHENQVRMRNGENSTNNSNNASARPPTTAFSSNGVSNAPASSAPASSTSSSQSQQQALALIFLRSPRSVESICAFDPPRARESVGSKKRHRMKRWEYHPHEVEVDLARYRKTVGRTRHNLHEAEDERIKIEATASHLRDHLVRKNSMLREECARNERELRALQLPPSSSSSTKSSSKNPGASGGATAVSSGGSGCSMKEALSILKLKGEEAHRLPPQRTKIRAPVPHPTQARDWRVTGLGGVRASPEDWQAHAPGGLREKNAAPTTTPTPTNAPVGDRSSPLAAGWLLPGDAVLTPSGEGVVVLTCGPGAADATGEDMAAAAAAAAGGGGANGSNRHGFGSVGGSGAKASNAGARPVSVLSTTGARGRKTTPNGKHAKKKQKGESGSAIGSAILAGGSISFPPTESPSPVGIGFGSRVLPERVCIRLSFGGLCYFHPRDVRFKGLPPSPTFSDGELKNRWEKMIETAKLMGSRQDFAGMDSLLTSYLTARAAEAEASKDDDDDDSNKAGGADSGVGGTKLKGVSAAPTKRVKSVLPFGAGLLAVKNISSQMTVQSLEKMAREALFEGGAIGAPSVLPKVTPSVKKVEARREELNELRGKVAQLRNRLGRQKRLRSLNERSYVAGKDRGVRAEGLLMEMKLDLTSLKDRLREELLDLGIDTPRAAAMLADDEQNEDIGSDEGSSSRDDEQQQAEESFVPSLTGENTNITTDAEANYNAHYGNIDVGSAIPPLNAGHFAVSEDALAGARSLGGLHETEHAIKRARA